jgi:valyl-tRNA synthetase
MGRPEKTKELEMFYPTAVLVTAADIIFFRVARMIMMGEYEMKEIPFKDVFLHGIVRDEK